MIWVWRKEKIRWYRASFVSGQAAPAGIPLHLGLLFFQHFGHGCSGFYLFQNSVEHCHHIIPLHHRSQAAADTVHQQTQQTQPLVEGCLGGSPANLLRGGACKDGIHLIIRAVLVVQLVVNGKVVGDFGVLDILADERPVNGHAVLFVKPDHIAEIAPATGRHKLLAIHR